MSAAELIVYISIVFWLLPPFRQFKGAYFLYFLILALSDPLAIFSVKLIGAPPHVIHTFASILLFYSINPKSANIRRNWFSHSIFIIGFIIAIFFLHNLLYIVLIIHLMILFKFLKLTLVTSYKLDILNIFYLVLIFYELSIIINLLDFLGSNEFRIIIYYMTLSFQILMAIFFTIFTEKSDFLILKLRSDN